MSRFIGLKQFSKVSERRSLCKTFSAKDPCSEARGLEVEGWDYNIFNVCDDDYSMFEYIHMYLTPDRDLNSRTSFSQNKYHLVWKPSTVNSCFF